MPVYKVTTMWNHSVMGVSESYYTPLLANTKAPDRISAMLAARAALMYPDCAFVGVRISVYPFVRQSSVLLPGIAQSVLLGGTVKVPSAGTYLATGSPTQESQLRQTLQVSLGYGSLQTVPRYMSGIPAFIVGTEPATLQIQNSGTWLANFNAFAAILTAGWQIRARVPLPVISPPAPQILGVVTQTAGPSLLGIVISAIPPLGLQQGNRVALTHFRPACHTRGPTINGMWTIDNVNTTLQSGNVVIFLKGSAGIDPETVTWTDQSRIGLVAYQLSPITSFTPYRIGVHKRGRPSMAPRGRRLTRPSQAC